MIHIHIAMNNGMNEFECKWKETVLYGFHYTFQGSTAWITELIKRPDRKEQREREREREKERKRERERERNLHRHSEYLFVGCFSRIDYSLCRWRVVNVDVCLPNKFIKPFYRGTTKETLVNFINKSIILSTGAWKCYNLFFATFNMTHMWVTRLMINLCSDTFN